MCYLIVSILDSHKTHNLQRNISWLTIVQEPPRRREEIRVSNFLAIGPIQTESVFHIAHDCFSRVVLPNRQHCLLDAIILWQNKSLLTVRPCPTNAEHMLLNIELSRRSLDDGYSMFMSTPEPNITHPPIYNLCYNACNLIARILSHQIVVPSRRTA